MARIKRKGGLLPKQRKLIQKVASGMTLQDAAKIVGYRPETATRLIKRSQMAEALDTNGLSDAVMAQNIKNGIDQGLKSGKATVGDAMAGLRLASELKGYLKREDPTSLNQTNVYINELKQLDDTTLLSKVEELTQALKTL